MRFEERLKEFAHEIGIDLIGITTAEPFADALQRLRKMEKLGYLSPWAEQDLERRCDPRELMEDAESIVAVAISYLQETGKGEVAEESEVPDELKVTEASQVAAGRGMSGVSDEPSEAEMGETVELPHMTEIEAKAGEFRGKLARFAHFQDYHHLLREKMEELVAWIRREHPEVQAEIYVDTGPLIDREVAYRAGLGFIGKNAALIHPEYGSFLALGEILLNLPLQPDRPLANQCGDCHLCLESCPQQVIKEPGEIETKECLAHYTQEKGLLDRQVRRKLGRRLWGCDTCQDVCPYNRHAQPGQSGLFQVHALGVNPDLAQILGISNREYKNLVGETAMAWRGKRTLQRNALINLGNLRRPSAIPILGEALRDQRPIIRGTAAWALGEIGGEEAQTLLEQALQVEKDQEVKAEIVEGLAQVAQNYKKRSE